MKFRFLIPSFLCLVFSSCQTVSFLTIEVKRPAEIAIPENVQSVVVVNNSVDQPEDFGHKAFSSDGSSRKSATLKIKTEGVADLFVTELAKRLNDLHWFKVYKQKLNISSSKTFLEEAPVSFSTLRQVEDSTQADMIISLDRYLVESDIKLNYQVEQNVFRVTMDARAYPTVRLYDISKRQIIHSIRQQDSLFWQNYGLSSEQAINGIPSPEICFQDMVMYSVDRVMKKIVPFSEQVERIYYVSGNVNLRDAANYVKRNRWDDAASIWEYLYENHKRTKIKAYSAANMALYCEISDKFDEAIEWAEKSISHFQQLKSESAKQEAGFLLRYVKELEQRKSDAEKLDEQLSH